MVRKRIVSCILFLCLSGCSQKEDWQNSNNQGEVLSSIELDDVRRYQETKMEGADEMREEQISIRMSFDEKEVIAILYDTPTTQSLLSQLPLEVTFEDYMGAEKITYLPNQLYSVYEESIVEPEIGDIACYGPWGNLVLYYTKQPSAPGIIPMGKIVSGLRYLIEMKEDFSVYLEQV